VQTPFRFRLERVLALREHAEESARTSYAAQLRLAAEAEARLNAAAEFVAHAAATQRATIATADGSALQTMQSWRERTERACDDAARDLARARAELDRAREALVAAHRERRALSALRERKHAEHVREGARREAALLDDLAQRTGQAVAT